MEGDDSDKLLGSNAIIVHRSDDLSHNTAKRVWFEAQKLSRQSSFLKFDSKFITNQDIIDGVSLYKRTASTSIIAVGDDTVIDFCKGLQSALENGFKRIEDCHGSIHSKSSTIVPLICVPFLPSYKALTGCWQGFNSSHGALMNIQGVPPQVFILMCMMQQFTQIHFQIVT